MRECIQLLSSLPNVTRSRVLSSSARRPLEHQCRQYAQYHKRVAVLGGGITGLAAAYFIRQQLPHAKVTLYEGNETLGGWLKSIRLPTANGSILFEAGPRSLRPQQNGALAIRLVRVSMHLE